ncbi:MAG: putative porin [Chromatiales bacterium]|nr:MAG: putative porin [Chromatiales bacterium]
MKRLGIVLGICLALVSQFAMAGAHDNPSGAAATISAADFEAFKRDMQRRVAALEAENAALRQGRQQNQEAVVKIRGAQEDSADIWTDRIAWKGDFRYRYQHDEVDLSGINNRNRQRVRARPALIAKLPSNIEVGFGIATGSDDPVSSNQTLGGGGSSKGVNLDLAYFSWGTPIEGLTLEGGKFKNEFVRTGGNGLLWDSDWRPEGIQVLYERGLFFGNLLGTWLEADSSSGEGEEFAWGAQAGIKTELGPAKIKAGASYFDIGVEGDPCLFEADDCFGNTAVPDPGSPGEFLYAFDFTLLNGFLEVDFEVFDLPSQIFVDYVKNDDADSEDTGYAVGARLGKAKKQGSWQASYTYQDLEADAVLGLLTDSDFAGGGTDSKGSKFGAAYALTDASKVKLTYFLTERQDSNGVENGFSSFDVDTLQLDFEFKYK